MKTTLKYLVAFPLLALFLSACESFINDVEPLKDYAANDKLNSEEHMDFLIVGVQSQFADASSQVAGLSDLLSDQLIFTNMMPLATYPQYAEIEPGQILLDNNSVAAVFQSVCRLRRVADDLVQRTGDIAFSDTAKRHQAYAVGYLYGGLARYYLATSFGINPTSPGGVIDGGPFIAQSDLLDDAVAHFEAAVAHQFSLTEQRITNSLIARAYLAKKDYAHAATFAAQGMLQGEDPFVCLYNDVSQNFYYTDAGYGRQQMGVADRFAAYIAADPAEAVRIPLDSLIGRDGGTYYFQVKYPLAGSSFPIMTWQENSLMSAECALRGSGAGDALALVNDVRGSHGLSSLSSVDLAGLMVERDKELFCQGDRLMDENRGAVPWHLGTGDWHVLPIPRAERDANPNLPPL